MKRQYDVHTVYGKSGVYRLAVHQVSYTINLSIDGMSLATIKRSKGQWSTFVGDYVTLSALKLALQEA